MHPIRNIVIVGGGTAGWLAACYLQRTMASNPAAGVRIRLVESRDIGTVGVGEATVPTLRSTLAALGIPEAALFADADATLKNGIRFAGWREGGTAETDRYDHPFEAPGPFNGFPLSLHWLALKQRGAPVPAMADACVAQTALMDDLLSPKTMQSPDYQAPLTYAYHLDAVKLAALLRDTAVSRGVEHLVGEVVDVQRGDAGIASLGLADGTRLEGDFFFDCSGFHALLLGKTLGVPWHSYAEQLPCDRAVAMPWAYDDAQGPLRTYTTATAQPAGWTWEIDLQSRTGSGYVYSSAHCSDDEAVATLKRQIGDRQALAEPRLLKMRVGRHVRSWEGNCMALGLAGGFIEPLESTAIYLIEYALQLFVDHLPNPSGLEICRSRVNQLMSTVYDELRDFVLLHYVLSQRRDSAFWRHITEEVALPASLVADLQLWEVKAPSPTDMRHRLSLFGAHNWFYILAGLHWLPEQGVGQAPFIPPADSIAALDYVRQVRDVARQQSPAMRDYARKVRAAYEGRPRA
jgi:tryptophan halogenase